MHLHQINLPCEWIRKIKMNKSNRKLARLIDIDIVKVVCVHPKRMFKQYYRPMTAWLWRIHRYAIPCVYTTRNTRSMWTILTKSTTHTRHIRHKFCVIFWFSSVFHPVFLVAFCSIGRLFVQVVFVLINARTFCRAINCHLCAYLPFSFSFLFCLFVAWCFLYVAPAHLSRMTKRTRCCQNVWLERSFWLNERTNERTTCSAFNAFCDLFVWYRLCQVKNIKLSDVALWIISFKWHFNENNTLDNTYLLYWFF